MVGRELNKDEEVHHKDGNKKNFWFTNLLILGTMDHGWVSAKQAYYFRYLDTKEKRRWDEFMAEQEAEQSRAIAEAKAEGKPWESADGTLRRAWEEGEHEQICGSL